MFFFYLARSVNEILLVLAAIVPAIVIFAYVYKKDTVEPEPVPLLISLVLSGMLAGAAAGTLESVGTMILGLFLPKNSLVYLVLMAFFVVGASEEGMKLLMLRARTWKSPHFNYTFDAIVYGVAVSIGFAALENVFYVLDGGFQTAIARAILSVPGHAAWGVIMGYYYGQAKVLASTGEKSESEAMMKKAFIVPMLMHGFYDTCAFIGGAQPMAILYLFSYVVDRNVIARLSSESHADKLVGPVGGAFGPEEEFSATSYPSAMSGFPSTYGSVAPVQPSVVVPKPVPVPGTYGEDASSAAANTSSTSFCPRCGVSNPTTHTFCFSCGQKLR